MDKGWCITSTSGDGAYIDDDRPLFGPDGKPQTWWDMRPVMLQIPYYDYVELKKWIIKECRLTNSCDQRVTNWERTLQNLDKVIRQK